MNLAYNYVFIALMLAELNFTAAKLDVLPVRFPISEGELHRTLVAPPWMKSDGGRLDTDKFAFSFSDDGRLCYIHKLKPFAGMNMQQRNDMLAKEKSLINTNDAYRMASNWLERIFVDVRELEKTNQIEIRQQFRWKNIDTPIDKDFLPVFDVKWGKWDRPKVHIQIDGRTKELLHLRLEDDSVSQRPAGLIKNREKLIAITDETFSSYSAAERDALVRKFAAIEYPPSISRVKEPTENSTNGEPSALKKD